MKKILILMLAGLSCSRGSAQKDSTVNISAFEFAYPFWSPDASEIVFQSNFTGNWQLYKKNLKTKAIVRLMENSKNDINPAWSPDGKKILFVSDRDGDEEIFTYELQTKTIKQLTKNNSRDIHPYWSPDGRTIVFNSERNEDNPKNLFIVTMDANGDNLKKLKEDSVSVSYASYSPDGKKIAFLKWMEKGNNGEIFLMNADGTGEIQLTRNTVWDAWPSWLSNNMLAYSSEIEGVFKLCSINIETKKIVQLTFGKGEDARANVTRDGKDIVFNRGSSGKIEILVLPFSKQLIQTQ